MLGPQSPPARGLGPKHIECMPYAFIAVRAAAARSCVGVDIRCRGLAKHELYLRRFEARLGCGAGMLAVGGNQGERLLCGLGAHGIGILMQCGQAKAGGV